MWTEQCSSQQRLCPSYLPIWRRSVACNCKYYLPSSFNSAPAAAAYACPFSDKGQSYHPVNLFSLFQLDSPCLKRTSWKASFWTMFRENLTLRIGDRRAEKPLASCNSATRRRITMQFDISTLMEQGMSCNSLRNLFTSLCLKSNVPTVKDRYDSSICNLHERSNGYHKNKNWIHQQFYEIVHYN